ncbi:MAG: hypothetical protein ACJAWL_001679 [Motiliproteus sp.]|jgi:hypothetical protein
MNDQEGLADAKGGVWIRGLWMLIFVICLWFARFVLLAIVLFQFLNVLFSGSTNQKLRHLGLSLSTYQFEIMRYLTYNSEDQPYPIGDWPSAVDSE